MSYLTQTQVNKLWDYAGKLCGICFLPTGTDYDRLIAIARNEVTDPILTESSLIVAAEDNTSLYTE